MSILSPFISDVLLPEARIFERFSVKVNVLGDPTRAEEKAQTHKTCMFSRATRSDICVIEDCPGHQLSTWKHQKHWGVTRGRDTESASNSSAMSAQLVNTRSSGPTVYREAARPHKLSASGLFDVLATRKVSSRDGTTSLACWLRRPP